MSEVESLEKNLVVVDNKGISENIASIFLGDRVIVQQIAIENGQVVLYILTHGLHDSMCCPTRKVSRKYGLRGHKLIELPIDN